MLLVFLLLISFLGSTGCGQKQEEVKTAVFCLNSKTTQLVPRPYTIKAQDKNSQIEELLNQLQSQPVSGEIQRGIPKSVKVNQHELTGYRLTIDFSEEYYDMDAALEVLVRAAVVKTMIQIRDIVFINFTVNGEALVNKQGIQVGSMNTDSFVENPGRQINTSQEIMLTLYFANEKGDRLVREMRTIHYSSDISLEKLVIEQLLEGPKESGHKATLLPVTKLITISVVDQVCYVNLDGLSDQKNTDISEDVLLYSIVNSLAELESVSKVQISVNGDAKGKLRYIYDLSKMYKQNTDLLEEEKKK